MNKILWIIALLVFVFVTVFVVSLDSTQTHKVQFINQDFSITNENNDITSSSINGNNANIQINNSKITNSKISANNSDLKINSSKININNSSNVGTKNVKFSNDTNSSKQDIEFTNKSSRYNNQDTEFETQGTGFKTHGPVKFKNVDTENLDTILKDAKNYKYKSPDINNQPRQLKNRYGYRNIDWNTWKSQFVNQILDDSLTIRSLDTYSKGAWFYYQFDVSDTGEISNILVKSIYLTNQDKRNVANLIKNYQYKPITVFPANTSRKTAKVSAVMVLSNETKHSSPKDFNDIEKVKFKLK